MGHDAYEGDKHRKSQGNRPITRIRVKGLLLHSFYRFRGSLFRRLLVGSELASLLDLLRHIAYLVSIVSGFQFSRLYSPISAFPVFQSAISGFFLS